MKNSDSRMAVTAMLFFWTGWMLFSGTSSATLPIQKQAKELGFPAESCTYCHNEKLPKKGSATHNDRGNWLIAEKAKRQAKEVDPAWLKEYPADKK